MGIDQAVTKPSRDRKEAVVAKVLAELPSLIYKVELEKSRHIVLAHVAGQASGERNFIRLLPGDLVEVDVSPHDLTRGRIVRKIQNESTRIGKENL
jgi:translation initiation factor IF-1